jgi:toxin ParE1/3/4
MNGRYRLSEQADQDLLEIAYYIALDSVDAADRFIERIHNRLELLAESPFMGRQRDELAPSLRSFAVGKYVIFYRPSQDGIEVIRVLHGARDIDSLFESE